MIKIIIDRYMDYINTDFPYNDYKYDLGILEQLIYAIISVVLMFLGIAVAIALVILSPIWGIPYLIYKLYRLKNNN